MIAAGEFAQDVILHPLPAVTRDIGGIHINAHFGVRFEFDSHVLVLILVNVSVKLMHCFAVDDGLHDIFYQNPESAVAAF